MTLTASDAAKVLATAKLVDNRQFDEATAIAWASLLDPTITLGEALEAVRRHMTSSTDYLMPAHINQQVALVRLERKQRIRDAGAPDFPDDLTYAQEQDYRREYHRLVGDGLSKTEAQAELDRRGGFVRKQLGPAPADYRKQIESTFRPVSRRFTNWGKWQVRGNDLVYGANRYRIPLADFGDLDRWVQKVTDLHLGKADVIADLKSAHLDLIGDAA